MKKVLAALLFAVLALAPLASACDTNYPNGIQGSPIKVNVANCSADNYTGMQLVKYLFDYYALGFMYVIGRRTGEEVEMRSNGAAAAFTLFAPLLWPLFVLSSVVVWAKE